MPVSYSTSIPLSIFLRQRRNLPRWFLACGCVEAGREVWRCFVVISRFLFNLNETFKNIGINIRLVHGSRKCNAELSLGYVTLKYASFTLYTNLADMFQSGQGNELYRTTCVYGVFGIYFTFCLNKNRNFVAVLCMHSVSAL
jgi:hypothetical protein